MKRRKILRTAGTALAAGTAATGFAAAVPPCGENCWYNCWCKEECTDSDECCEEECDCVCP
jgi:hypothetical protein